MRRKLRRAAWEAGRWTFPPAILSVVAATIAFYFIDIWSSDIFLRLWRAENIFWSAYQLYDQSPLKVSNVGLCLVVFLGAGLYAQDYESGAVFMRVQRLGAGRYAGLRIMQTALSAFVSGGASLLLLFPVFAFVFKLEIIVPWEMDGASEGLLAEGHMALWLIALGILAGLRTMFYALLTLLVSLFIPRRKVLVAAPYVLCYFFDNVVARIAWLPGWLNPRLLFETQYGALDATMLGLAPMSEWRYLGIAAGVTLALCAAVWILFRLRLKRGGIFGGEQSE